MSYKYALLCMHGMGDLDREEFKRDIAQVKQALVKRMSANDISEIYIPDEGVFYSDVTQNEEVPVWNAMNNEGGLNTGWIRQNTVNELRKFFIYGFSDATAFTGFNGFAAFADDTLPYTTAQWRIHDALQDIYDRCGKDVGIVILSQSLGCQIMSNYLWDAQLHVRGMNLQIDSRSIWSNYQFANKPELEFLRLQSLKTWFTTGCNIPIFVSGFKDVRAVHNREYGYNFNWINYFDYDDVLGWPLRPLHVSFDQNNDDHGRSYADVVTDIQVNANDGILGVITSSWNPLSHLQYWGDSIVLGSLVDALL